MAIDSKHFPDGWLDPAHVSRHIQDVLDSERDTDHPENTHSPSELVKEEFGVALGGLMGIIDALSPRDQITGQHRRPVEEEIDIATRRALIAYHTMYERMPKVDEILRKYEAGLLHDPLTGLYVKSYFPELEHMLAALGRRNVELPEKEKVGFALMVFDVDDFKEINDVHGHPAGDVVLKTIGQRVQEHRRSNDIPIRYGGDEFIVYMDGVNFSDDGLATFSDKVRQIKYRIEEPIDISPVLIRNKDSVLSQRGTLLNIKTTMGVGMFKPQFARAGTERLKLYESFSDNLLIHAKQQSKGEIVGRKFTDYLTLVDSQS